MSENKNNCLQAVRGIAICAVILIHLRQATIENGTYNFWLIIRRLINFPVPVF